jgi:Protein of unknown function (DUF3775)
MPDINTDKVCYVIAKARELESEDEGAEADASSPSDDKFVSVLRDGARGSARAELTGFIDAMDEDEQCELIALSWIGRGDFDSEEWKLAIDEARTRRGRAASAYLLGNRLLAAHLESGLAEFGGSCEGLGDNRQSAAAPR